MIYALLFLGVVCSVLAGTIVLLERSHAAERARLVNHLLAEKPEEYTALQRAEEPRRPRRPADPDRPKRPAHPEGL